MSIPEVLRNNIPDINKPGILFHSQYADKQTVIDVLQKGLTPRGGGVQSGSFFPNRVSLSATINRRGYSVIANPTHWSPLYTSAFRRNVDMKNSIRISWIVDPEWVSANWGSLRGVGTVFTNNDLHAACVSGGLENLQVEALPLLKNQSTYMTEVHSLDSVPPNFPAVVVDAETDVEKQRALDWFREALSSARAEGHHGEQLFVLDIEGNVAETI